MKLKALQWLYLSHDLHAMSCDNVRQCAKVKNGHSVILEDIHIHTQEGFGRQEL